MEDPGRPREAQEKERGVNELAFGRRGGARTRPGNRFRVLKKTFDFGFKVLKLRVQGFVQGFGFQDCDGLDAQIRNNFVDLGHEQPGDETK